MNQPTVLLIDATAFCYRAFYAIPELATSSGEPTNAVYGFIKMLNKVIKEHNPQYLAVCFDVSRETFRQKQYKEYKIHRAPMPDKLSSQIPLIKEIVLAYGIAILQKEGFEADDIIATVQRISREKGLAVTIVSSDKDILQLVDEKTKVFNPHKDQGVVYDIKAVCQRYGIGPQQITELIALMGDSADNIPGVPGIGEKTAVKLIHDFGSLDELLSGIDRVKQGKLRESIEENIEMIKLNRKLALLDKNVEIGFDLESLRTTGADYKKLFELFKRLEFKAMLQELPGGIEHDKCTTKAAIFSDEDIKEIVGPGAQLFLYGANLEDMIFFCAGKFFRVLKTSRALERILRDPKIKKISHDLKKIKVALARQGIIMEGLYFDTMIAAYLLNPSRSDYSLSAVALDHLGKIFNDGISRQQEIGLITELMPVLGKGLNEKALESLFNRLEMPLVEVLADMELAGIKLSLGVLKELSFEVEQKLVKLIDGIYDLSGTEFNINSPKQLREILFEKLKLPVGRKSKTGPSTDEEVLRKLSAQHKLPQLLLEYRQLMKLKNTYIDTLPGLVDKKTGRLHTSFNQAATETGRLSSSNPNLQNIPIKTKVGRNIRRSIVAYDQNSLLLSCDYSQVELRILAHLSQDENLISSFKADKDIHKSTAALIYGVSEEAVSQEMREEAKRINFGIIYGQTSYGLSRDLDIPMLQAQNFIDAYFLRYPKVKEYVEGQIEKAQKDGFVTTLLGRRRYLVGIDSKNQSIRQFAQRQAVNTPIQGLASDLIKLAMTDIHKQITQKKMFSKMILQVHDELLFNLPKEELDELWGLVKERMENVLKLDVPVKVDIKVGKNWLEMSAYERTKGEGSE
jgi:DNA polymerase-1